MAKLSAWVKKHLSRKPHIRLGPKLEIENELPFLPSPRRPITPNSFDTPACSFFQLPYDIRNIILTTAFGGRTLHVHIETQEDALQDATNHVRTVDLRDFPAWRGAICGSEMSTKQYAWANRWNDECMKLWHYISTHKPELEERGVEYNIGITGFLLSCKQAYAEGIEVLYSANCINIQSEALLLHLPRLIPPSRLESITYLEICIKAHICQQYNPGGTAFTLDHTKPILGNITTHCHRLRKLCISFNVHSRKEELINSPVLPWVDALCRSMQLRNMRVELPYQTYWSRLAEWPAYDSESYDHPREGSAQNIKGYLKRMLWRSLDDEEPRVQSRSVERYPNPPLKLPVGDGDESAESKGYWIAEGDTGPQNLVCTLI
jgi:hypothetical protein